MNKQTTIIRCAKVSDLPALEHLATVSGLFTEVDLPEFQASLEGYFSAPSPDSIWLVGEVGNAIVSAAFAGLEPFSDRVFNLYFIAVDPALKRQSIGREILAAIERHTIKRSARIMIVETSGLGSFKATRHFYRKNGYAEEARLCGYYGPGDDKVIFWKKMQ